MPDQRRADKTIDKMRRGGLPSPTEHRRKIGPGDATPCDGCTESIESTDRMHSVRVRGVLDLRFHDPCYNAWASFTP